MNYLEFLECLEEIAKKIYKDSLKYPNTYDKLD